MKLPIRKIAVSVLVVAFALFAKAEFTVYNIVPLSLGTEDVAAKDAIELYNKTGSDLALYCLSLHPEGKPAIDKAKKYIESFRLFKKAVAGSGVRAGVLVQSILGHWPRVDKEIEGWTRTIDSKGAKVRFCPDDPGFAAYIDEVFRLIAMEAPAFVMTDDDLRGYSHNAECFCDRHMKIFNERAKSNFTAESLRMQLSRVGAGHPIYKTFFAIQREMVEGVAKRARAAMDAVDPIIPAGMCIASEEHYFAAPIAKALAAKGQAPIMRTSTGCYSERMTAARFPWIFCRMLGFSEFYSNSVLLSESDTCPHNLWSKSSRAFLTHLEATAFAGMNGTKAWCVNAHKHGFPVSRNYSHALESLPRLKELSKSIKTSDFTGLAVPCFQRMQNWHLMKNHSEFFVERNNAGAEIFTQFGIPFQVSQDFSSNKIFALLSREEVNRLTNNDLRKILSGKVVVFRDAALMLTRRGFGAFVGVEAQEKSLVFNSDRDEMNKCNIPFSPLSGSVEFKMKNGAKMLSFLTFSVRASAQGGEHNVVSPSAVLYKNNLGGTVLTLQYDHKMHELQRYSELRRRWLVGAIEMLAGEKLPIVSAHEQDMMTIVRKNANNEYFVMSVNLSSDPVEKLSFKTPLGFAHAECLSADGKWVPIESSYLDGVFTCEMSLGFYESGVVRLRLAD